MKSDTHAAHSSSAARSEVGSGVCRESTWAGTQFRMLVAVHKLSSCTAGKNTILDLLHLGSAQQAMLQPRQDVTAHDKLMV